VQFDAIVIGSGITGGWAAKELTEAGLKTLVLERGPHVEHVKDYADTRAPWQDENRGRVAETEVAEHYSVQGACYAFNSETKRFFVRDSDHPYLTPPGRPFHWYRGYHLGGRSLTWGRQTYRWSDTDFEANGKDGFGVDWPIRYADIASWYDHVERFAGISGSHEALPQLPDGAFQPPMELTCIEADLKRRLESQYPTRKLIIGRCAHLTRPTDEQIALGRAPCQYQKKCERGCSFGAYFSSLSATLPAARRTGNLVLETDSLVVEILYDARILRASGVRVINARTKAFRTYQARVIFVCASTIGTAQLLLNSRSESFPRGIANRSDAVGRYLMDHVQGPYVSASYPGFDDRYYVGRRPNGCYVPRYGNVTESLGNLSRGFALQGDSWREDWHRGAHTAQIGATLKADLRHPGPWKIGFLPYAEMLPRADNRVTLHPTKRDRWGIPLIQIDCTHGPNDRALIERATADAQGMLQTLGCRDIDVQDITYAPGEAIHEMGTARMGRDPATSVLNAHNQAHDVANLFITDGACMASTACQNPSLTYMALTARASHYAAGLLKEGNL
jgi:choline dehydrogenase-like flavoprotein